MLSSNIFPQFDVLNEKQTSYKFHKDIIASTPDKPAHIYEIIYKAPNLGNLPSVCVCVCVPPNSRSESQISFCDMWQLLIKI